MNKKIAYVFPGQGSQAIGMLTPWAGHPIVEETVGEAANSLDCDLWRIIQYGPVAELNDTVNTQPVMVATSVAYLRAWQAVVPARPAFAAGHSVGEFSALVAAGMLELGDAVRLVRARARAMNDAVPAEAGGMAAVIGLDDAMVHSLCRDCAQGEVLEPVNYNAPGQVVVAGHVRAIHRLKALAKDAGAKMVFVLPVSGPFHSALMQPAADVFRKSLASVEMAAPRFDVLHNCNLLPARLDAVRETLVAHLTRPVRWVETIRQFEACGVTHLIEIGPGEVLANLARRIAPAMRCFSVCSPETMDAAAAALGEPD